MWWLRFGSLTSEGPKYSSGELIGPGWYPSSPSSTGVTGFGY